MVRLLIYLYLIMSWNDRGRIAQKQIQGVDSIHLLDHMFCCRTEKKVNI